MRVTTTICTALLNSPHFTIRGFSDLVCQSGGGNNRKSLGQLDLFVTSELNDRASVLAEFVVE